MDSFKCNPGDILVRTKQVDFSYPKNIGDIFEVVKNASRNSKYAKYIPTAQASPDYWRHATMEEALFYKRGGRNIKNINYTLSDGFIVNVKADSENYREFYSIMKKYNLGLDFFQDRWGGTHTYYGVHKDNRGFKSMYDSHAYDNYRHFEMENLEINLKQLLNNEKIGTIESIGRCETKGSIITSSCIRRIATSSRFIGNSASARHQKSRIASFKISSRAISS